MKNIINRMRLAVLVTAVGMVGFLPARLVAEPSPDLMNSIWQTYDRVTTTPQGDTVAMVCAKCKTVLLSKSDAKKGFLGWLQPKTKHECPGCGGEFTMKDVPSGQGANLSVSQYSHTCSKCGDDSAFCCAVTPGAEPTKGMEKK